MPAFESGIELALIEAFLRQELALEQTDDSAYIYRGCSIRITPLSPRKLGRVDFPRNELCISGDEEDAEEFKHKFLMRFLSAGG